MTHAIASLGEIAGRYDAVLSDVWGVIHDGKAAFPEACAALARFRATSGPVLLLSNAPRPGDDVVKLLDQLGVPRDAYDGILTSGDATRAEMVRRGASAFHHIGPERDRTVWEGLPTREVQLTSAEFILCTGLFDDERETPDDYAETLATAREAKLSMICANPDIQVHRGSKLIWCAGALAAAYEKLGGEVIYFGKPHPPVYDTALKRLTGIKGAALEPSRILAIGDGLRTDILGANRVGVDALFVTAGIHGEQFADADVNVAAALAEQELFAAAYQARLKW
ncbi:MAG: TIGR01459 family HAD-type hydrolase [Micropepsaceae bacterium]